MRSALVGAAFGVAGVVAARHLRRRPRRAASRIPPRSGWNWTFAPDVAEEERRRAAVDVDGVEDIGVIRFGQVQAGGERMTGVSMRAEQGTPSFTVVRGRMPSGPREVALGPKTADQLGLGIGDPVDLDRSRGARRRARGGGGG